MIVNINVQLTDNYLIGTLHSLICIHHKQYPFTAPWIIWVPLPALSKGAWNLRLLYKLISEQFPNKTCVPLLMLVYFRFTFVICRAPR